MKKKFIVLNQTVFDVNDISYAIKDKSEGIILGHRPPRQPIKEIYIDYVDYNDVAFEQGKPTPLVRDFDFLCSELVDLNTEER